MLRADRFAKVLLVVFVIIVGSFSSAALLIQRASAEIDTLSESIVSRSAPSIERLATLRGSTLEIELLLSRYIHSRGAERERLGQALDTARARLDQEVQAYLSLAVTGRRDARHWNDVQRAWAHFDHTVQRTRELVDADRYEQAQRDFVDSVEPSAIRILDSAMAAINTAAEEGGAAAERIQQVRDRTRALAGALTPACALLAVAGGLLLYYESRSRRALIRDHTAALEARAAELEYFAGRVAHDIRNPLSSARMAAELGLARKPDPSAREALERIVRALTRADAITTDLLEFARSGARPDPGARVSVRELLADVASSTSEEAARMRVELRVEPVPPVQVACSSGVYLSLVGNLLRNALKYMGNSPVRRITLRVTDEGPCVRTEVEDTGPGIEPSMQAMLFEPYSRGPTRGQDGLGLGLATVKKLVESHGGRVGVRSAPGAGSTFWFTLPSAGRTWENGEQDSTRLPTAAKVLSLPGEPSSPGA